MRGWPRYLLATAATVLLGSVAGLALLPVEALRGLLLAGFLAWCVQAVGTAFRVRLADRPERWLVAWGWGSGARLLAVAVSAVAVYRLESVRPLPTLLGVVAYLFMMMLMEPVLLDLAPDAPTEAR